MLEKPLELGVELLLHPLNVLDRERQQCCILQGLNCELSNHIESHCVDVLEHFLDVHFLVPRGYNEVDVTEGVCIVDLDVHDVLLEGEHETSRSLGEEVDLRDPVCLVVDVLLSRDVKLLQEGADPPQEALALVLEVNDCLVRFLIEVHDRSDLQPER